MSVPMIIHGQTPNGFGSPSSSPRKLLIMLAGCYHKAPLHDSLITRDSHSDGFRSLNRGAVHTGCHLGAPPELFGVSPMELNIGKPSSASQSSASLRASRLAVQGKHYN